jgi:hypothetical protein
MLLSGRTAAAVPLVGSEAHNQIIPLPVCFVLLPLAAALSAVHASRPGAVLGGLRHPEHSHQLTDLENCTSSMALFQFAF